MGTSDELKWQPKVHYRTTSPALIEAHICIDNRMYPWRSCDCEHCIAHIDIMTTAYSIDIHNQIQESKGNDNERYDGLF